MKKSNFLRKLGKYSTRTNLLIVGAAAGAAIAVWYYLRRRQESFLMTTDPAATGIERPLWGPGYKISGYASNLDYDRYAEMRDQPECSDPLKNGYPGGCPKRDKSWAKYEDDKI